jgi:hypothetical protein
LTFNEHSSLLVKYPCPGQSFPVFEDVVIGVAPPLRFIMIEKFDGFHDSRSLLQKINPDEVFVRGTFITKAG